MYSRFRGIDRAALAVPALLLALLAPAAAAAGCSAFVLDAGDAVVCGKNLDWDAFPSRVFVNPRGATRSVLPWRGWWPDPAPRPAAAWTARHGSVTFSCYGREFIEGGMNEAGLAVAELSFAAEYAPDDGRPGVSGQQWMQYLLDLCADVGEALTRLDDLRLAGEPFHYFMADAGGDWAVIEYVDGAPRVERPGDGRPGALTNTGYRQALDALPLDRAFGGEADIAAGDDSYGRFVRMAALMRDRGEAGPTGHAFRILESVKVEDTRRSVVFDAANRRVSWTTAGNPERRFLDFGGLDLEPGAPVLALDVEEGGPGDVSGLLRVFEKEDGPALTAAVLEAAFAGPEAREELKRRGLTLEQAADLIGGHPDRR